MNDKKYIYSAQNFEYSAGPKKKQHSYKNKKKVKTTLKHRNENKIQ